MTRYLLAHLDDRPGLPWEQSDPNEEIYVLPFGADVVTALPLGALGKALPLLAAGTVDLPEAGCPGCGERLPAPRAQDDR